jgi:prevent-host-death family protein
MSLLSLRAIDKGASGGYIPGMKTVGLKVLKNRLSEYVRAAAAGETVVITDRGRVVAELVPPRPKPESVIERGVREGWIRPAVRGPDWPPQPTPIEGYTLEQLLADLGEDREDPGC